MSMVMCPECGTGVSDRALACPYCGFVGDDPTEPIAGQAARGAAPRFKVEVERWDSRMGTMVDEFVDVPDGMGRRLFGMLGDPEWVRMFAPGLLELIGGLTGGGKAKLVADLPGEVMRMVEEGRLFFRTDSEGRILPQVVDADGIYRKQVRLEWERAAPDVMDTMRHLQTQAAIAMVLAEVHGLRDQIEGVRSDLQNDRLALAEGAWDKLMQARAVEDSRLRDMMIARAVSSATDAKRTLMRNFAANAGYLREHSNERVDRKLVSAMTRQNRARAADAFDDLVRIADAVRVEGTGYAMLGQDGAGMECLAQFRGFITANGLDDRDALRAIDSHLPPGEKMPDVIDWFADLSDKINALADAGRLDRIPPRLLETFRPADDHKEEDDDATGDE